MPQQNPIARESGLWKSVALRNSLFSPVNPLIEKLLSLDKLREVYQETREGEGNIFDRILQHMEIACAVRDGDLARVPSSGPAVVTANHPFGILDGILLGSLMLSVRPDVKILTNHLLTGIPELDRHCIPLDPFAAGSHGVLNQRGLRGATAWLQQGGMLLVFPAGEVAHLQWNKGITDPEWSSTAFRLAKKNAAVSVPVFIDGRNSVPFQLLGFIHPSLRTARLPHEFLHKQRSSVEVRIGKPVCPDILSGIPDAKEGTAALRWRTYVLANRTQESLAKPKHILSLPKAAQQPIAAATPAEQLEEEVRALPASACLDDNGEYSVYCAEARQIPKLLHEIGRLRELSFRAEGEGTGEALDIDAFDSHYRHLLLWHKVNGEVVGAYRLANTRDVLPKQGISGLYTSTLFRFKPDFFECLGPAVELGRSFVRPEYQRQYAPLLLLWKAIGRYVARHPENPVLFGAVSISNTYAPASRTLMYQFFQQQFESHELSAMVQPRRAFRSSRLKHWDVSSFERFVRDPEELSGSISEFECDGKGIPILLKQYLKVGGEVLAFNVDGKFAEVLDGLIVVDLRKTDNRSLQRYLGNEGAEKFRTYHATSAEANAALKNR